MVRDLKDALPAEPDQAIPLVSFTLALADARAILDRACKLLPTSQYDTLWVWVQAAIFMICEVEDAALSAAPTPPK